jgi:hypothetical protein
MTSTATARQHRWVFDIEDTVTLHLPDEFTQRIVPPPRRPDSDPARFEDRRSFAGIGSTGEIPLLGVAQADPEQERFTRFCGDVEPPARGRHRRTDQPGLLTRLFGRGRRD